MLICPSTLYLNFYFLNSLDYELIMFHINAKIKSNSIGNLPLHLISQNCIKFKSIWLWSWVSSFQNWAFVYNYTCIYIQVLFSVKFTHKLVGLDKKEKILFSYYHIHKNSYLPRTICTEQINFHLNIVHVYKIFFLSSGHLFVNSISLIPP